MSEIQRHVDIPGVSRLKVQLLKQTLPSLCQHKLHQHVQHIRSQIHTRRVGKILVYVSKCTSRSEKSVHSLIQTPGCSPVLFSGYLGVQSSCVEEDRGFLEGNGALTARYTCERVVPLEVDAEATVRREKTSLDEVQLIVVAEEQTDTSCVPRWCPRCLENIMNYWFVIYFDDFCLQVIFMDYGIYLPVSSP